MKLLLNLFFISFSLVSFGQTPIYKDAKQSTKARVNNLLSLMTLDEKVMQTQAMWQGRGVTLYDDKGQVSVEKMAKAFPNGLGQVTRPSENPKGWAAGPGRNAKEMAEITNAIQKFFLEKTRLGIPVIFHEEALHGHPAKDATSFPQSIALASSWDDDLAQRIFSVVGQEIRLRGAQQVLAPVIDIARDPRWGRFEETYGEDPYLVGRMGVAAVKGFQGDISKGIDKKHVLATLKHMTGHGQPEAGNNVAPANLGERTIREAFLLPFQMAIKEAKAQSVMASYNEIDGVPSHASTFLLQKVLRNEWGFEGTVISDYNAIIELQLRHHLVATAAEAGVLSMQSGVDIETPDPDAFPFLKAAVQKGILPIAVLDEAVKRILTSKFDLGLFDSPYTNPAEAEQFVGSGANAKLALEAAHKSIVLLENKNNFLPLNMAIYKKIAVIGPNAARKQLGGYSDEPKYVVTLLDGIKAKVGDKVAVAYAEGCRLIEEKDPFRWYKDGTTMSKPEEDAQRIEEAVKIAQQNDLIILALGSDEGLTREGWAENHLGDRSSIELFGRQNELLDRLKALGKPIVITLFNGAPLAIQNAQAKSEAILECWYLGQEGGTAVADVLFGTVNPSGKLPCTFPRSSGHIPSFYNAKPSAQRGFHFEDVSPLYPFGHGLSYTTYKYENLKIVKPKIKNGETVEVSIEVSNTGKMAGNEIVQLYIRDLVSTVTRPVLELKDFTRVALAPGEKKTLTFKITPDKLAMWDLNMKYLVEPGTFEVMVGASSASTQKISFVVE